MEKLWDFLISVIGLLQFWVVLPNPAYSWVFTLGRPTRYLGHDDGWFGTGFHLKAPFNIEEAAPISTHEEWADLAVQSIATSDGHAMTLQGTFRYKILADDSAKLLSYIVELGDEDKAVPLAFQAAIASVAAASTLHNLTALSPDDAILEAARRNLNRYGVKTFEFRWIQRSAGRQLRLIM